MKYLLVYTTISSIVLEQSNLILLNKLVNICLLDRIILILFFLVVWCMLLFLNGNGSGRVIIRPSANSLWVKIYTHTVPAGRNSYPYLYPSGFSRVSGIRRVYHSTYKNQIKIISLMSKSQYTHVQN
jgi:hypothetical protein